MDLELIYKIRENTNLYQYLKYHSYLYKDIIRGDITYKELNSMMKKDLKLTSGDKMNNLKDKVDLLNTFLDLLS